MSPRWFVRNLVRALLVPVSGLVMVSLATASPVEAASPPPAQPGTTQDAPPVQTATPDATSPEKLGQAPAGAGAAAALSRRVSLGTAESARLKRRAGAQSAVPSPMIYHGGQGKTPPQFYLSLWGSDGRGAAYQSSISYLQGFFGNVGGSSWLGVTSQY